MQSKKLAKTAATLLIGFGVGCITVQGTAPITPCFSDSSRRCIVASGSNMDDVGMTTYKDDQGRRWYLDDDDLAKAMGWEAENDI